MIVNSRYGKLVLVLKGRVGNLRFVKMGVERIIALGPDNVFSKKNNRARRFSGLSRPGEDQGPSLWIVSPELAAPAGGFPVFQVVIAEIPHFLR
ncbi:MAG: hypothetical protein KDC32_26175, partial [Saprospiraceae bacterium]|nr:hypothetical protein [Saprospiraceae bacterium]